MSPLLDDAWAVSEQLSSPDPWSWDHQPRLSSHRVSRAVAPSREVSPYRPVVRTGSAGVAPWVVIAAAAAIAIGSFLPWATVSAPLVGTISKSGVQGGDGIVSLVGAGVLALLAFIAIGSRKRRSL